MKKCIIMFYKRMIPCLVICFCTGWNAHERAETWGAKASMEVCVVDEDGGVVSNADVEVYFDLSVKEGATIKGRTDNQGVFSANGKTTGEIYINVWKRNWYATVKKLNLAEDLNRKVLWGRWMPDKIPCKVTLRHIRKPIKLITSKGEKFHKINEPRVWMGFDIIKDDWVFPYGKGETVDFEVLYESDGKKLLEYTGSKLTIRFVRPYDGAYVRKMDLDSKFQTDFEAMTNGHYKTEFNFFEKKNAPRDWSSEKISTDQFLVLRVRSNSDAEGRFIGAHYAMIKGALSFGYGRESFGFIGLNTYFNPTFNDPNLEEKNIYNTPNFGQIGGFKD